MGCGGIIGTPYKPESPKCPTCKKTMEYLPGEDEAHDIWICPEGHKWIGSHLEPY